MDTETNLIEDLARFLHQKHGDWRRTWDEVSERGKEAVRAEAAEIIRMVTAASA